MTDRVNSSYPSFGVPGGACSFRINAED
ncbi:hypothetical protein SBA4_1710018 [Candidatus Sulfopaludibacter sp. SbA4]|nr:hypothetical protein SBA4_1710018 [Candidatus Sulfopaludibacter sp. SbA4]